MAVSQLAYSRIAKKVQVPVTTAGSSWSAPSVGELIARIDAALARRAA